MPFKSGIFDHGVDSHVKKHQFFLRSLAALGKNNRPITSPARQLGPASR